jgi:pyruvate/2-oxoglutarate dehydrogenase complex dihydrolipoamide dehydrogenase (E3) component
MTDHFDAAIIGAGQAGGPLATAFAESSWHVALIEREHVGGTCVNVGCTPTKTMVASARVAYLVQRAGEYGIRTGQVGVDMAQVRERKRAMVTRFRNGSQHRIEAAEGVDLMMGEARFTKHDGTAPGFTLSIQMRDGGHRTITADQVFLNTGARPHIPDIPGLSDVPYLDSTTIMELDHVPQHLIVLGGGYIGLEFGQMFRRFGSQVTIIQRSEQLLSREDSDVAEAVTEILQEDGINVLLRSRVQQIDASVGGGSVRITVETPERARTLVGSHVLVATGRTPNTDALNLEAVGVKTDNRGFIEVDTALQTNVRGVYALGDVKGGPAFTHISYDDFRILRENLLHGGHARITERIVPYTIFIDPQLGRVGLGEQEARAQGYSVRVAKLPMSHVARAMEVDETRGFMKAVVDGDTQRILGCAVLGIEGGEIATMLQIAMMGSLPYTALRDGVFSHPTLGESLNNLFMALDK